MTAAASIPAQITRTGQFSRVNSFMSSLPSRSGSTRGSGELVVSPLSPGERGECEQRAASPHGSAARFSRQGRSPYRAGTSAGRADGGADAGEGAVGVLAERGDGGDADHDNQGQH